VIACWCLGITQHRESVATIQEIVNLMLLRGNVGRAGTGLCPVRGHSNVQGNRTMGIGCQMSESFLASLEKAFGFTAPRRPGLSAIPALRAMLEGRVRFLFSLGGNLAAAAPDTEVTTRALRGCRMTVMVSTKLNRSHLICGEQAVILPCLGRTEIDRQGGVPQFITVENTAGVVHSSRGCVEPSAPGLMSEPRLVAELAQAVLGSGSSFPWPACAQDYGLIRRFIEQLIPGYTGWGKTLERDAGFRLPNPASSRDFAAVGGKAKFMVHALSAPAPLEDGRFLLMTIRSHDQFNTTIHGLNDRYRGIRNERRVIFLNPEDMKELGIEPEQAVDITSHFRNVRRTVRGFYAIPYTIPKRCAAAYFPEANPLVPLDSVNPETMTPTSKSIVVSLQPSLPGAGRQRRTGGSRRA
jgi:molybdopterin-dependent oxidoreductase alpha subunit